MCVWDIHTAHPLLRGQFTGGFHCYSDISSHTHIHVLNTVATYVFEMAKNNFCPSGGTLADSAVTSLRFSSIWLRTLLFNWKQTMPNYILKMFRTLPYEAICVTGRYQRWVWLVTRHKETQWHELSHEYGVTALTTCQLISLLQRSKRVNRKQLLPTSA